LVKKGKTQNSFQTDWWVLSLKDRGSSSKLGRETQTNLSKQNPKKKYHPFFRQALHGMNSTLRFCIVVDV